MASAPVSVTLSPPGLAKDNLADSGKVSGSKGFPVGSNRRGNLYIVSGPSGAGKGTLIAGALQRFPGLMYSISCTTRPRRPGEIDGRDYYFLTKEEFEEKIHNDALYEWAELYGYYYGTPRDMVQAELSAGKSVILEIDVQGARLVRGKAPESIGIFIRPPSIEVLAERLRKRSREDEEELERRLELAEQELEAASEYDFQITNDEMQKALEEIITVFERCEATRC